MKNICDIIICTYNRQQFIEKNLGILSNDCSDYINHVYVIDNASNLSKSLNSNFISIIPNKNLGGAGGYARGMYEAQKDSICTHILLMDDDISFDKETIKKAINKLNEIGTEDWLAFGMRSFEKPNVLYENTAYWSGVRATKNHYGFDLNSKKDLSKLNYNYAAWWSLIMPISVIKKYGYPMPYFIKSDDVEYGLRRTNEKIHYYKDISVLHEDFNNKYSETIEYYNIRNYMITNALHFKHARLKSLTMYVLRMGKSWLTGHFLKIKMSNVGLKDFLKGPELLMNIDACENNIRVRNIVNGSKINFLNIISYPFVVFCNALKILFKYNKTKKNFLNKYKYLTSEKYWLKQFNS